jgi:predicted phage tail protein
MFRVIKVYGKLAKHLGQRSFKAAVKTPAEAIRFLLANFPSLREVMNEGDYKLSVGRSQLDIGEHPEYIHLPSASFEPIRIIPVVTGAGGATGKILAGVGLIAASFLFPGAGLFGTTSFFGGTAVTGGILTGIGTALSAVGASLVLGGVAQLLTPTPQLGTVNARGIDETTDPRRSYSFSGIQNVSRQGVPIPLIYGEVFTGSVVISAGINTEEIPT